MATTRPKLHSPLTVMCDYCGKPAALVDSAEIYRRSYGPMWLCRPCDACVGTHKNSPKHHPLGRLANRELREAKKAAHAAFDPVWRSGRKTRQQAYGWLAEQLGIPFAKTHIGMFDVDLCRRTVEVSRAFMETTK